jgi:hypothetical protein
MIHLVALALFAVAASVAQTPRLIDRVAWLQGCWQTTTPGRTVEEIWIAPKGGSMIGISRTIQGDALTAHEMILLRDQGGRLAYEAHPSGQPPATFLSTTIGTSEIVFENPKHDFPQQIGYRLNGDALLAWIAGTKNGKSRRVEFPYRRAACGLP